MIPFFAWVDTIGFWDWWFFGMGVAIGLTIGAGSMMYYFDREYQSFVGYIKAFALEKKLREKHEKR